MYTALLVFVLSFSPSLPHWTKAHDSYRVHNYYLDGWNSLLGDYYQMRVGEPYTAQCNATGSKPVERDTEEKAIAYVESCPQ